MKFTKKALVSSVAAVVMAAGATAPVAHAEVSASVGIASTYLWRGLDLGSGIPAVSGSLDYEVNGFYTGIWGSSGDRGAGSEFDLYVGYAGEFGDFSYGIAAFSYNYHTVDEIPEEGVYRTEFGDVSDLVLSLGYGPVAFDAYIPIGKENSSGDYMYYTLGAAHGSFSILLGMHHKLTDDDSPVHLDLTYAYNDNLSFTLSQFIADEPVRDKLKFVVSYSLPIGN